MTKQSLYLRRMTVSAVFLAVAVTLETYFSFYIPLFGENGMRVGIAGVFASMPAFLFGPLFGLIVFALRDIIGFILRPSAAYLPLMTAIVSAGGFIRGWLWLLLRERDIKIMRIIILVFSVGFLLFGIMCMFMLSTDNITNDFYSGVSGEINTVNMHFISRWLITRTQNASNPAGMLPSMITGVTTAPIGGGIFGLVLLAADMGLSALLKKSDKQVKIMPMLISALTAGIVVTTLNTILLSHTTFRSWLLLPFVVVWLPRVVQEIISNTVIIYFVAFLMGICNSQPAMRRIMR